MVGKKSTWQVSGKGALVFMLSVLIVFVGLLFGSLWMTFDGMDKVNACKQEAEHKYLTNKAYFMAKDEARTNKDTVCKVTGKQTELMKGELLYVVKFDYEFLFNNQMQTTTDIEYVSSATYDKTNIGDIWDNINKRPITVGEDGKNSKV